MNTYGDKPRGGLGPPQLPPDLPGQQGGGDSFATKPPTGIPMYVPPFFAPSFPQNTFGGGMPPPGWAGYTNWMSQMRNPIPPQPYSPPAAFGMPPPLPPGPPAVPPPPPFWTLRYPPPNLGPI